MAGAPMIVAHRGSSAIAPENTIAAFQLAWKHGADAIEGDFRLTADGQIVCIHDASTERVSRHRLEVTKSTYNELCRLDVGTWKHSRFASERIPRIADVLATVPPGLAVFIEVKCGPEIVPVLKRELDRSSLVGSQTVTISFNNLVIRDAKRAMPNRPAYWLSRFDESEDGDRWQPTAREIVATATSLGADGVGLQAVRSAIDDALVADVHVAGLSLHVWTVNDLADARYFRDLGIDSITTNRPKEIRAGL